jgi:hypothetical protein
VLLVLKEGVVLVSVLPLLLSNPVWLHLSAQVQGSVCLLLAVATAA